MASVNKVILIGNLGRDPEVRYMPSGGAVCNISVATTRSRKDKSSGDKIEETEWHRVVLFERQAEIAGEYLKKGRAVYIEGRLQTRKWQDKEGRDTYTTEVIADTMQLLGSRDGGGGSGGGDEGGGGSYSRGGSRGGDDRGEAPQRSGGGGSAPSRPAASKPQPRSTTGFDDMDDDIPF